MKTKNFITAMLLVFPFLLLSCGKNDVTDNGSVLHDYRVNNVLYAKGSKLKHVYQVYDDGSKILRVEYSYDNLGRISRLDRGFELWIDYDIYLYNTEGKLEKISSYEQYLNNPLNLKQTISYSYNADGNKVKELYEWEDLNSEMQTWYYLYYYNGKQLTKREYYKDDQLSSYVAFEYEDDKLKKEKTYAPESDDFLTTEHSYDKNLLL
jgi:hypothetical protein